jgi:class 3 adenylate cyclase/predicted negative regulator of RcsB-dependent stress response
MDLRAELVAAGVDPADAAALAGLVASPPPGMLDAEDERTTDVDRAVVCAAILAAGDLRRFSAALPHLLARLEDAHLDSYDLARWLHVRGFAAWRLHDELSVAMRSLNAATRTLTADGSPRAASYLARVHDTFGQLLFQQGLIEDARREYDQSRVLREQAGDRVGLAITLGNLGRLCMHVGQFALAAHHFARDLAIVEELSPNATRVRAQLRSHLAECKLRSGAIDEAEALYEDSAASARANYDLVAETFATVGLGRVALARGDAAIAARVADDTIARIASLQLPHPVRAGLDALAHQLAGDAYLAAGEHVVAIDSYRAAIAALQATANASPIEHAEALRGLAVALAAKGELADSAQSLRRALAHLDATAADGLRREVERELKRASYDSWLLHSAGRFIGQRQIESLLDEAGEGGFRGERKRVIVMFSDLRGFTTLSERLAADELIVVLNEFLTLMTRCIERHGGMVNQFVGDAVMALFPYEAGGGDRAIRGALAMRDELERFNRRLGPSGRALSIGIGLHGGEVVAGLVGSPQKRGYTVVGDVVNTASRLEGMTKQLGASILVTSAVLDLCDRARYRLRPLGTYVPKGKNSGLQVFDVMGEAERGAASRPLIAEIERVEGALAALNARSFERAAAEFDDLAHGAGESPRALGYKLLADRARELGRTPPPREWSGEIKLYDK